MTSATPSTAVYIPHLAGAPRLISAVGSIRAQTEPARIVVVDNGSRDGSADALLREFPDVTVVRLGTNLGFGAAINRAVQLHPAARVVLLNDDARAEPRFLEALLEAGGGGSVAGVLLQESDPARIDSAGVTADATLMAFDYLQGEPVAAASGAPAPLGPTGGAALIDLEAFNRVGGFDERIFAYLEDLDLALRLRSQRIPCRLAPDARAVHAHSATLGAGSAAKYALTGFSRGYLLRRYGVLTQPGRATHALARELAICCGQVVFDGTVSGFTGRVRGWRAGRRLPRRDLPEEGLVDLRLGEALRLRMSRSTPRIAARRRS